MKRTKLLQEIRKMEFERIYTGWRGKKFTQEQAARILGVCERTFRRYINQYDDEGMEGLYDKRLTQASHRRAPLDEVLDVCNLYQEKYSDFNTKHFYRWYQREHDGERSYTWVKNTLQNKGLVQKGRKKGPHRKKRERSPYPGMMIHQDGSTHEWVPGRKWDLIVTMDDATNEHYSIFFVDEEGTSSSFTGVHEVIENHGLFSSFYSDRGSHYWYTPKAGGKVDKINLTQFGRAMAQLGIEMIAAYSPEARGRSERMFSTHQDRLVKELAMAGITGMAKANQYIKEIYMPNFNNEFVKPAPEKGSVFVPWVGENIKDILCEHHKRTVNNNNCVAFRGLTLQIPANQYRCHYVKVKVRVNLYDDRHLAVFHGPRKLATYDSKGNLLESRKIQAA
ncbi:MAG: ISNCY family transposase [Desulfobacula sp.]|jgi:transposase|nr:ISNCY family transposase [Desulfobacula sp.]